jgi:phospholipid transport system substrate-binding protein
MRWKAASGILGLSLIFQIGPSSVASAGVPTEQLRGSVTRVLQLVGDPAAKRESVRERRAALRKVADEIFDWEETARRSLGLHWQQRTLAERQEFVRLFADLLERSYLSKIELYDGERIGYGGDTVDGDQAVVRTTVIGKHGSEMGVNYRMLRRDGDRWKVYDVEIEGVSLISNYRTQFNTLLRRSSYPELVRVLKSKSSAPEADAVMASPR